MCMNILLWALSTIFKQSIVQLEASHFHSAVHGFPHNRCKIVVPTNVLDFESVHFLSCLSLQWNIYDFLEDDGRLSEVLCSVLFTAFIHHHKHAHIRIYYWWSESLLFYIIVRFL